MSENFKIIRYNETERLNENGSNWTFWKTHVVLYLKGLKLWPYIAGTVPKPDATETKKLMKWEEVNAQALHYLDEYGPKCPSWTRLLVCKGSMGWLSKLLCTGRSYCTKSSPKHYMEGGLETLPGHIAKLQPLRE